MSLFTHSPVLIISSDLLLLSCPLLCLFPHPRIHPTYASATTLLSPSDPTKKTKRVVPHRRADNGLRFCHLLPQRLICVQGGITTFHRPRYIHRSPSGTRSVYNRAINVTGHGTHFINQSSPRGAKRARPTFSGASLLTRLCTRPSERAYRTQLTRPSLSTTCA
jgi:hypothetical protein